MRALLVISISTLFSSTLYLQEIKCVQQMLTFVGQIFVTFPDTAPEPYSQQLIQENSATVVHSILTPTQLYTSWTYSNPFRTNMKLGTIKTVNEGCTAFTQTKTKPDRL